MDSSLDQLSRLLARREFTERIYRGEKRSIEERDRLCVELESLDKEIADLSDLLGLARGKKITLKDLAHLTKLGMPAVREEEARMVELALPRKEARGHLSTQLDLPRQTEISVTDQDRIGVDFPFFTETCLEIPYRPGMNAQSPDGGFGPFILTSAQRQLAALFIRVLFVLNKPLRVIILKSRQLGCTTFLLAFWVWLCLFYEHFVVMVIIDKDDHSITKREMVVGWLEKIHRRFEWLPSLVKKEGKILFLSNGSKIIFESAQSPNPGTSEMIRGLHCSEKPKWPANRAQQVEESVTPGLPSSRMTVEVDESTAMGMEAFYFKWRRCEQTQGEEGELTTIPVFLSWFVSEEYTTPVPKDFKFEDDDEELWDFHISESGEEKYLRESEYAELYGLTQDQVYWRRGQIKHKFKGNRSSFDQEFPTTPAHAWRSAMSPFFSGAMMDKVEKECLQPTQQVRIVDAGGYSDVSRPILHGQVRPVVVPDRNGELLVVEPPLPGRTYFVGADFAEGKAVTSNQGEQEPDKTVFSVKDEYGKGVALFLSRCRPEEAWLPLLLVCMWYNYAWVNGERNSAGHTVLSFFVLTGYPKMLINGTPAERPVIDRTWTVLGPTNRRELLNHLRSSFAADPSRITCAELLAEMRTFINRVQGGKAHPEAAPGCHDDIVFADMHAEWARFWLYGADRLHRGKDYFPPEPPPPVKVGFTLDDTTLDWDE